MSLSTTKENLTQVLNDNDTRVLALSGKWGTGKSHMWRDVKKESTDTNISDAIYVSLFGVSNMDQLMMKIVQSDISNKVNKPAKWKEAVKTWLLGSEIGKIIYNWFFVCLEVIKRILSPLINFLTKINIIFTSKIPATAIYVSIILKKRVIVLDDIERKHKNLGTDEVLGFVYDYSQQHDNKFVLILNSDELDKDDLGENMKLWETFREKVIDHEIKLETTPEEAFDIASKIVHTPYNSRIKHSVLICEITNIRIICKILRAFKRIFGKQKDLPEDVLDRIIPSTVLLSATYYKGIEGSFNLDTLHSFLTSDLLALSNPKKNGNDAEDKDRIKWRNRLWQMRIYAWDEYEQVFADYLKTGLFDELEVTKLINLYASDAEKAQIENKASQFCYDLCLWHLWKTDAELIDEAKSLLPRVHLLNANKITFLCKTVSELQDGTSLAVVFQ